MQTDIDIIKKYWFFEPDYTLQNNLMAFGFETFPGWWPMLDELCEKLDKLITEKYPEMKEDKEFPFRVLQVKEKFATLRFYCSYENDEISDLIEEYVVKSENTCEQCGKSPARIVTRHGWYMTRCEECIENLDNIDT